MKSNIWSNLSLIKEKMFSYTTEARENNWITSEECENIQNKIAKDTLIIGVIGQMKSGKSTFLNALLFNDNILPTASTPMTAALSIITYGEQKQVVVEFYTQGEWDEIVETSYEKNDNAKIKAAKELVEKSRRIGTNIQELLGTSKTVSFDQLINFVGTDGRYVAITKSVTIKYPNEKLKGVKIVDTPGFNDPVKSREERTNDFLSNADVVILLLYAGRAFDITDKNILFERVRNVGTGRVIIGINKFDVEVGNGNLEQEISQNVIKEINKAVREKKDAVLNEVLANPNPILLSASMALMAKMDLKKINSDDDLKFHFNKICGDFEISTQKEMLEASKLKDLEDEIDKLLLADKLRILIAKPLNEIFSRVRTKRDSFETQLTQLKLRKDNLNLSDDDLDDKLKTFHRAQRKVNRIIEDKESEINEQIHDITTEAIDVIRKLREDKLREIHSIIKAVEPAECKSKVDFIIRNINFIIEKEFRQTFNKIKKELKTKAAEVLGAIEEILLLISDGEDRYAEVIANCNREISKFNDLTFEGVFSNDIKENKRNALLDTGIIISFGLIGLGVLEIFKYHKRKQFREDAHAQVDKLLPDRVLEHSLDPIKSQVKQFTNFFESRFMNDLLEPIIKSIEDIQSKTIKREDELKQIEKDWETISQKKKNIESKLAVIEQDVKSMPF